MNHELEQRTPADCPGGCINEAALLQASNARMSFRST
jgi:hypothetical protein